jgi:hypothetical protein
MNSIAAPSGFFALNHEQQIAHRTKIGLRVEAILSQFWREDTTPEAIRALEIEGWIDVLENCSHAEIRQAWATYQRSGPRTANGRLCKPDAGALYKLVQDARPRPQIVRTAPEPIWERPRMTAEHAAEIMREVGWRPRTFGGSADE